ncbi:MAG: TetR/AcrR family transcriptional regulator [Lautropia sp.]
MSNGDPVPARATMVLSHERGARRRVNPRPAASAVKAPASSRRNPESHRAVLAAAEALLHEIGYSSITIDRIAERSGVAKATIYRWWPNKAAVCMELYIEIVRQQTRMPADTGSLEGDVREHIRTAFRVFRTTVAGIALAGFVADAQTNPNTQARLQEGFAADVRALNLAVLERARKRGELAADISPSVAAEVISGAIYYQLLIRHRQFSDADADQIADVILRGIKAPEA